MQNLQFLLSEPRERVLAFAITGEIDLATVAPLRDAMTAAAKSGNYDDIVIDLLGVDFIDSSGLHVIAETQRALRARGGDTKVICTGNVRKLFEIIGLNEILTLVEDRDEAYAVAA